MTHNQGLILTAAAALTIAATLTFAAAPAPRPPTTAPSTQPTTQPKPLSDNVTNGLKWLVAHQNPDGGWPQGEESSQMGAGMEAVRDKSNVGDTCIAILALLRSGSTPAAGPYAENIRKGIAFVTAEIEKSDEKSLSITSINGTRIQGKLGPNIDTFLASLLLGETRNKMPDPAARKPVIAALDKVMDKIEKNMTKDGQIANGGWAGSIAQGVAVKGLNVAAENGARVSEDTLKKLEDNTASKQGRGGATTMGSDSAGVQLYASASNVSALQQQQQRLDSQEKVLSYQLAVAATQPSAQPAARAQLQRDYDEINGRREANGKMLNEAAQAAANQVKDDRFIAGFGSNGGEEFLSYLNLGETLFKQASTAPQSAEDWKKWDEKMTANLNNFQNKDGSWSGQHCITGRTFCTSAALMVLLIDREESQIATQLKRR